MESPLSAYEQDTVGAGLADPARPADPAASPFTPRAHTRSNATRLLSAGAYLEDGFRSRVIRELDTFRFRTVAPSYGYDAVTVLAHALAARTLQRKQIAGTVLGFAVVWFMAHVDLIGPIGELLLLIWVAWVFGFLRRIATLQAMIQWLRPTEVQRAEAEYAADELAVADDFPAHKRLDRALIAKIAQDQAGLREEIKYGGYRPFVGAGDPLPHWTTAELLLPQRPDAVVAAYFDHADGAGPQDDADDGFDDGFEGSDRDDGGDGAGAADLAAEPKVVTFSVDEITEYVGQRLLAELRDEAHYGEEIKHLTIERRKYSHAGAVPIERLLLWRWRGVRMLPQTPAEESFRLVEERERYGAAREYLCVRVGSWDQEVVTSVFVGFDLRGNTLYSEFYPHLMPPVRAAFHLVDRLPLSLAPGLLMRVGLDTSLSAPRAALGALLTGVRGLVRFVWRRGVRLEGEVAVADASDFKLGRYAVELVDTGALASVRELACTQQYHHFFQEADVDKYVKVIERRLLQVIRDFLIEHNVDVADHDARQTTILDNSTHRYGDAVIHGDGVINQGGRRVRQSLARRSPNPAG